MLTHGNIAANQNFAAHEFDFNATDACISFLPLSHITARALDYVMYGRGAQVAYCSQFDKLPQAMKRSAPYGYCGGSAGLREDSPGGRAEVVGFAGEEEDSRMGSGDGCGTREHCLCGEEASRSALETGQ